MHSVACGVEVCNMYVVCACRMFCVYDGYVYFCVVTDACVVCVHNTSSVHVVNVYVCSVCVECVYMLYTVGMYSCYTFDIHV